VPTKKLPNETKGGEVYSWKKTIRINMLRGRDRDGEKSTGVSPFSRVLLG